MDWFPDFPTTTTTPTTTTMFERRHEKPRGFRGRNKESALGAPPFVCRAGGDLHHQRRGNLQRASPSTTTRMPAVTRSRPSDRRKDATESPLPTLGEARSSVLVANFLLLASSKRPFPAAPSTPHAKRSAMVAEVNRWAHPNDSHLVCRATVTNDESGRRGYRKPGCWCGNSACYNLKIV
jgi:hypothetical protein